MRPTIEHIVEQHQAGLYRLCLGYVYDREEARDLVQDVLVKVWKHLPEFREEATLNTWVYRIAVNTCLMHLRKKKVPTVPLELNRDASRVAEETEDERLAALRAAISQLSARDRILILLHLDNHSYDHIASIMGFSTSNVGARLTRIRKKLTQQLQPTATWTN